MANCGRCGKETELYDVGIPICLACINEQERKRGQLEKWPRQPPHAAREDSDRETH